LLNTTVPSRIKRITKNKTNVYFSKGFCPNFLIHAMGWDCIYDLPSILSIVDHRK
jgi:hypothetical protein